MRNALTKSVNGDKSALISNYDKCRVVLCYTKEDSLNAFHFFSEFSIKHCVSLKSLGVPSLQLIWIMHRVFTIAQRNKFIFMRGAFLNSVPWGQQRGGYQSFKRRFARLHFPGNESPGMCAEQKRQPESERAGHTIALKEIRVCQPQKWSLCATRHFSTRGAGKLKFWHLYMWDRDTLSGPPAI